MAIAEGNWDGGGLAGISQGSPQHRGTLTAAGKKEDLWVQNT